MRSSFLERTIAHIETITRDKLPAIRDCITMNLSLKTPTNRSLAKPLGTGIATSLIIGLAAIPLPTLAQSSSNKIWSCQAENATRKYVVDQLDLDNPEFDMAIYIKNKGDDRDYSGTITIVADQTDPQYIGNGVTDNSRINVRAMGRTVAFYVDDSKAGFATGRCWANWEMADKQTRRLVRQCFAMASQEYGGRMAEVTRAGCTTNPVGVLVSLKPQGGPRSNRMNTVQPRTDDEQEILAIVAAQNQTNPGKRPTIVTKLVTSQSYGLYRWVMGATSGQTVVRKGDNGVWTGWPLRLGRSGLEDIENLQKWGVPKPIALDLVAKMSAQEGF